MMILIHSSYQPYKSAVDIHDNLFKKHKGKPSEMVSHNANSNK